MGIRLVAIGVAVSVGFSVPSAATVLVNGSGWQADRITAPGAPSENSDWTFTIAQTGTLSVTDAFIPGDIYTISGDLSGTTGFYSGSLTDIQATGSYGIYWTDNTYSKIAISVGPGTYRFRITGNGNGGLPAGLGVRLDASAVPEPGSWIMMTSALGAIGMAMRRRRRRVPALC